MLAAREAEKNRINEERINQVPVFLFYNWFSKDRSLEVFFLAGRC
jgi:hypothetical protein